MKDEGLDGMGKVVHLRAKLTTMILQATQSYSVWQILAAIVCMGFMVFILAKGIIRGIRNDRGWRKMEEDRRAQGLPFYGYMEEEYEKDKYGIDE